MNYIEKARQKAIKMTMWNVTELAKAVGVSRKNMWEFITGRSNSKKIADGVNKCKY